MPLDAKLKKAAAQEKRTAGQYNGARTPQSGAGWVSKNDVRTHELLIENKRTDNVSSITIHAKDLEGLDRHACQEGRQGILQFDLNGREYVILRSGFARELLGLDE
jgi:hypothetical protein